MASQIKPTLNYFSIDWEDNQEIQNTEGKINYSSVAYLVSLLMVGITGAAVGAVAFFCVSSFISWLMSGEE